MSESTTGSLKETPLCGAHRQLGGRMVEFGGWLMPVQYTSILEEHLAVRQRVGLFDISHMGEIWVSGPQASNWLNKMMSNDVNRIEPGQAQYTILCNERGGAIDDLIVYRIEPQKFLLVVNAGNAPRDWEWMQAHAEPGATLENASDRFGALALQGPRAVALMDEIAPGTSAAVSHFRVQQLTIQGTKVYVARTGYTGEDGFELMCAAEDTEKLWSLLLTAGAALGIKPCGLGARDTLRLEMCYPLHGHELGEDITPLEAGLGIFVALDKEQFIGKDVLVQQKQQGTKRRLVPFKMVGKVPPPRAHYAILKSGNKIGEVTSGSLSPSLGIGVGMGYIEPHAAKVGDEIEVDIRERRYGAVIERKPLYKKPA